MMVADLILEQQQLPYYIDWDAVTRGPQGYDLAIGSTVSINSKSANPEAAAEVLNWLYADAKRAAAIASISPGAANTSL